MIFYIILFLFSILIGFRAETVGTDTHGYINIYNSIGQNGYDGYPEPLYGYLNFIFYRIGFSFYMMQWMLSIIMLMLFASVILKNSPNRNSSLFVLFSLFFIFYTMNVTRQMLAVSMILYGYSLLNCKKIGSFVVWVLIASTCHLSAIVALLVLFVQNMKIENRNFYLLLVFSVVIGTFLFNDGVFQALEIPYAGYMSVGEEGVRNGDRVILSMLLILFWSCFCIFLYKIAKAKVVNSLWFKIYFFGVLINNITYRLEMGLRVVFYFSIVQIIVIPVLLYENREIDKFVPWIVVVTFLGIFFFIFLANGSVGILPYSNVLFD